MPTLFLDRHATKGLIRVADVIKVVEEVFGMCGEGRGRTPAKTHLSLEHGDLLAMPTAPRPACVGAEMANVEPENPYPSAPLMQKAVDTYESGS
jgi:ornithine cyclodeaminase/alanine dehydrogenase-like protein (mu-crystallin family)